MVTPARSTLVSIPSPSPAPRLWRRVLLALPSPGVDLPDLDGVAEEHGIPVEVAAELTSDVTGGLLSLARVAQLLLTIGLSVAGCLALGVPLLAVPLPVIAIEASKLLAVRLWTAGRVAAGWHRLGASFWRWLGALGVLSFGASITAALVIGVGLSTAATLEQTRDRYDLGLSEAALEAVAASAVDGDPRTRADAHYLLGESLRARQAYQAQVSAYTAAGALPPFVDLSRALSSTGQDVPASVLQTGTVAAGLLSLELLSIALGMLIGVRHALLRGLSRMSSGHPETKDIQPIPEDEIEDIQDMAPALRLVGEEPETPAPRASQDILETSWTWTETSEDAYQDVLPEILSRGIGTSYRALKRALGCGDEFAEAVRARLVQDGYADRKGKRVVLRDEVGVQVAAMVISE